MNFKNICSWCGHVAWNLNLYFTDKSRAMSGTMTGHFCTLLYSKAWLLYSCRSDVFYPVLMLPDLHSTEILPARVFYVLHTSYKHKGVVCSWNMTKKLKDLFLTLQTKYDLREMSMFIVWEKSIPNPRDGLMKGKLAYNLHTIGCC